MLDFFLSLKVKDIISTPQNIWIIGNRSSLWLQLQLLNIHAEYLTPL